jgi:peptidoglycan/LPS O-acetylase OafA/YrhL
MSQGTTVTRASDSSRTKQRAGTGRIPELDGLRGIAILLVLLWHGLFGQSAGSPIVGRLLRVGKLSWSGVDLFFVLSGFLIGGILLDARESPRYYSTFYARRAYRILPLYAAMLGLYFLSLFVPFGAWVGFDVVRVPAWAFLTFAQNCWMAWAGNFDGGLGPTWSLAIEEQFYLTLPFVIRNLRRKHLVVALSLVVVAAPILRTLLFFLVPHGDFAAYVLMPCRADALCLGVLSAILARDERDWKTLVSNRVLYMVAAILFLVLAWLCFRLSDPFSMKMATFGYTLLALFYTCALLIALSLSSRAIKNVLTSKRLRQLGVIAYCTYLVHVPMLLFGYKLVRRYFPGGIPHAGGIVLVLGGCIGLSLTLVIATLSWKFFEQPMLRKGQKYNY